jgi:hypothetical protein
MEKIVFQMAIGTNSGEFLRTDETEGVLAFELFGFQWVAHKEIEFDAEDYEYTIWKVSEVSTGRNIPNLRAPTFEKAADKARKYLEDLGEENVKEGIRRASLHKQTNEKLKENE